MLLRFKKDVVSKDVAIIQELETASDRVVGIIMAAVLEDVLGRALKSWMIEDEKIQGEMFGSSGPLGTFSSKINLGLLLGMYSKMAWKELDTIRKIRNEFAHEIETSDFSTLRVRSLAQTLVLYETKDIFISTSGENDTIKINFKMMPEQEENAQRLIPKVENPPPRIRYMLACRFYTLILSAGPTLKLGSQVLPKGATSF